MNLLEALDELNKLYEDVEDIKDLPKPDDLAKLDSTKKDLSNYTEAQLENELTNTTAQLKQDIAQYNEIANESIQEDYSLTESKELEKLQDKLNKTEKQRQDLLTKYKEVYQAQLNKPNDKSFGKVCKIAEKVKAINKVVADLTTMVQVLQAMSK